MGEFFADVHASAKSQLGGASCRIADTPEITMLRTAESYEELLGLAKALCWQLRYLEAIEIYTRAIALKPESPAAYRQRAARYISTLQPLNAVKDLLQCRALGLDPMDISYRLGISCYLAGDYHEAIREFSVCYPLCDDEMGIAVIFWHTLSSWHINASPKLLHHYHTGMQAGHHTAYERVAALAAGKAGLSTLLDELGSETDDMQFSILGYGTAQYLYHTGCAKQADSLIRQVLSRDGFWITYGYLAAWNALNMTDS